VEFQESIKVGKIVGTHGYKGIVKVQALTDFPERFKPAQKLIIGQGKTSKEIVIENCSLYKGLLLMKLQGIDTLDEAVLYRNQFLSVDASEIYPLPEGHYYHFQLLGMRVDDLDRGYLGELTDILETGANDVYVVKSPNYGEILLPAIKKVILKVDPDNNRMQVKLLPGLVGEEV
jgi:16S rRNA processing protein RimM